MANFPPFPTDLNTGRTKAYWDNYYPTMIEMQREQWEGTRKELAEKYPHHDFAPIPGHQLSYLAVFLAAGIEFETANIAVRTVFFQWQHHAATRRDFMTLDYSFITDSLKVRIWNALSQLLLEKAGHHIPAINPIP